MGMINEEDDNLFESLLKISETIERDEIYNRIIEQSLVEFKSRIMMPIYDEYWGSEVVGEINVSFAEIRSKNAKRMPKIRDPKGGLTPAGRAYFKRKEGANLKPGVKGPANTPEKMRRKGSFLTRFFTNPSGPMKDDKGRATRLALSAAAWGEPVPQNAEDAASLAAKGRRLLDRYAKIKDNKKSLFDDVSVKTVLSSSALMDFQAPQYMRGMVGGDLQSIKGLDLDAVQDSRRRRLVMEEMTNIFVADKKSGDSYIAGSVRDMKRMNTAHSDMMQIRKKKIKSKTKNRKVKKNVNND